MTIEKTINASVLTQKTSGRLDIAAVPQPDAEFDASPALDILTIE